MSKVRTGSTVQRGFALFTAVALAVGGAVALAPGAAHAASDPVVGGSAKWGFMTSFRNYVAEENGRSPADATSPRASITVSEGATFDGTVNSNRLPVVNKAPYTWPIATSAGTYDPATRSGTINYGGKVALSRPDHEINLMAFANPTVTLNGNGSGTLYLDVKADLYGGTFTGLPNTTPDQTHVAFATLSGIGTPVTTEASDGSATEKFSGIQVAITDAGADAMADYYLAGRLLDPLTISFNHGAFTRGTSVTTVALSRTTVAYGAARTAKVSVKGGSVNGTGAVTLKEGSRSYGTKTLAAGSATYVLPTNLAVGRHTFTASFAGAAKLLPSARTVVLTVTKARTTSTVKLAKKSVKVGKKGKVTARVTAAGFTPGGKVTVKEGSKTLKTATLKKGSVAITLPKLKKGKHKLVVRYAGSGSANASTSSKVTLTVKK